MGTVNSGDGGDVTRLSKCARCGLGLPLTSSSELCAACADALAATPTILAMPLPAGDETRILASAGVTSAGNDLTMLAPRSGGAPRGPVAPKLALGQSFGPYRVERLLGRGGMGDVYEAEHLEHGRRVAIKVLNSALAGADDLARFLSEGELAASITHPNTVYIFGSEEIDGAPVIAMELLSGGTLRDLVQASGPLPPARAVDLILQVIAGLDAAAAIGVLHRDVKPANCFIDLNGAVKVGDFGLSISTAARQESTGMFLGTPQFAAPEQIRGEALDARADIYAVGGTLFYLLTGQPPFDDRDLTTLVTRVTTEAPRSPREMSANVPPALADIVTRSLAKDRGARPASYTALEDLLRPFSSTAPIPASLSRRFLSGVIDQVLFVLAVLPITMFFLFRGGSPTFQWLLAIGQLPFWLLYFSVLEGRWGASLGKRLLGLHVVGTDGQRPGMARALLRAAVYQSPALITTLPYAAYGPARTQQLMQHPLTAAGLSIGYYAAIGLLFSTARRRNGYAALQDRASRTRVIRQTGRSMHTAVELPAETTAAAAPRLSRTGPFEITGSLGTTNAGELKPGFDPQLKRRVWIHVLPPGTPAVAPLLRDLGRLTRLRWLSGRRTSSEAWDAYEAFDGLPLVSIPRAQPWGAVRRWALDLAMEVDAGLKDGSLGVLTLDRVWITRAGRAKLLDFPAPGVAPDPIAATPADLTSAQGWLSAIATRGLSGSARDHAQGVTPPLPLSGRTLLDRLDARGFASAPEIVSHVTALQSLPGAVQPWRRVASVLLPALTPIIGLLFGILVAFAMRTVAETVPNVDALSSALAHLNEVSKSAAPGADVERHNLEIYIAGTFRSTLADEKIWVNPLTGRQIGPYRTLADHVLETHPQVTADDLNAAKGALGPFMEKQKKDVEGQQRRAKVAPQVIAAAMTMIFLGLAAAFGLLFAVIFRGGLLFRAFGLAAVDAHGRRASRARALWRAFVAWMPAAVLITLIFTLPVLFHDRAYARAHVGWIVAIVAAALVFLAGVVVALVRPTRGIQDVVAGTYIVPR